MIDYEKLHNQMLNDKHIEQWVDYLPDLIPGEHRKTDEEITKDEVGLYMYKKGYEDCLHNIRMQLG